METGAFFWDEAIEEVDVDGDEDSNLFRGNVAYDSIILIGTIDDDCDVCKLFDVNEFLTRFFGMFSRSGYMLSSFSMASCDTDTDINMLPYGGFVTEFIDGICCECCD